MRGGEIRTKSVKGLQIAYVEEAAQGDDFTAYAVQGNTIIIATREQTLSQALQLAPLSKASGYASAREHLPGKRDGELYAGNHDGQFAAFLHPLERKWGMSLLLSADSLQWMASAFDVVDSNTMTGSIVFQGATVADLVDIQDDAEFLGEAFKRKFMAERIDYTGSVTTSGTTVTLAFSLKGLEPLWLRLFEQGLLSVIRPGS